MIYNNHILTPKSVRLLLIYSLEFYQFTYRCSILKLFYEENNVVKTFTVSPYPFENLRVRLLSDLLNMDTEGHTQ